MIQEAIALVVTGQDLNEEQMTATMQEIMSGQATDAQIGSFMTALRMKGETIDEIAGAVRVMREKATFVDTGVDTASGELLMDIVGTGGDGSGTFNVSTTTAFVVAGAGIPVAKHGNRAISSSCGSADVLEALGVDLSMPSERVAECVRTVGIGFLFAPMLHGAMKHAIGPRREMGIRTIFNILGPMTNPARANVQLTGVFAKELTVPIAQVLSRLGMQRTLVVWGEGNMDEMTITGTSHIADAHNGTVASYTVNPEDVGLTRANIEDIQGGADAEESASLVREVLGNTAGARLDMVLLNAGAALLAAGKAADLQTGVEQAREIIASGAAVEKLEQLVAFCQQNK
ncbi:MAG: anthranilate phosphoribosyltransferase [Candidatus Electrothrix sp. AS4_5]|nr:anthranilate phosphoribosyltransferase [Candidatus Electrothrix gigas]MCI5226556.1 anthranilate phosphoribosyltransferase [Candidatus Electrothrix gigas]